MRRKGNRLDLSLYRGRNIYFVSSNTAGKRPVFTSKDIVSCHRGELERTSCDKGFDILVYCFMPDHLHLLLAGISAESNLIEFMKAYKQVTGFKYKKDTGAALWQKSYHDHILRREESIDDLLRYILENPVRKALVQKVEDYPFSGSLTFGKDLFFLMEA